jgi:UDP-glucose 4-epimerase
MQFLITGGAGFIGSHLARHLGSQGTVTILDNLSSGREGNLGEFTGRFLKGSILDSQRLDQALNGITHVFHLAAMVSVPESVAHPARCHETNIEGTRKVLEASDRAGVKRVVLASSCAIYGNEPTMPKIESLPPAPASPYAESKLAGEKLCASARNPAVSLRFFNVYGPRQDPHGPYAAAVPKLLEAALAGSPLPIHGDGQQTRDFVFVEDVVSALLQAALHPDMNGIYNVASGESTSILQLAEAILAVTGSRSPLEYLPARPADVRFSSASIARLQATGWRPSFPLIKGLSRMLEKN